MTFAFLTFTLLGLLSLFHGCFDASYRMEFYRTPDGEVELAKDGGTSLAVIFWYYAPAALAVLTGACLLGVGLAGLTGGL